MRAYIASCIAGSFAFDASEKMIAHRLFSKNPIEIAERMEKIGRGEVISEEIEIAKELKEKGYNEIFWDKESAPKGIDISFVCKKDHPGKSAVSSQFRKLALQLRWVATQSELNEILTKVNVELTRAKLTEKKDDRIIVQAVGMLDELDKIINVMIERLREWYGLHFPEAARRVDSPEKFAKLVSEGNRIEVKDQKIASMLKSSSGMEFSDDDIAETTGIAVIVLQLYDRKKILTKYIEKSIESTMPNTGAVAGHLMAARLLYLAGSLEKMARMPSSTIQLLGAEKALFRHLKGEGKAPKYGILFGHPMIQKADKKSKGKAARMVASKISIAVRLDMYSQKNEGEKMKKDLEHSMRNILG